MAFDQRKDKIFKAWKHVGGLVLQVASYDGGVKKIQIGPRKVDIAGSERIYKVGRISMEELEWMAKMVPEVRKVIEESTTPKKGEKDAPAKKV